MNFVQLLSTVLLLGTHVAVPTTAPFRSSRQETATVQPTLTSVASVWPYHATRPPRQTSRHAPTPTTVTSRRGTIWLRRLCSSFVIASNASTDKLTIHFRLTLPLMVTAMISKAPVDGMTRRLKLPLMTATENRPAETGRSGLALVVGERTTMSCASRHVALYSDAKHSMAQRHRVLFGYAHSDPFCPRLICSVPVGFPNGVVPNTAITSGCHLVR